jgi:hypothetical protein
LSFPRSLFVKYPSGMPSETETELEQAVRHVAEARKIIANQRALIERLKHRDLPTAEAEATLLLFKDNLEIFERHERELRKKLGR